MPDLAPWIRERILEEGLLENISGAEELAYRDGLVAAFEEVLEKIKEKGFVQNTYYL